MRAPRPQDEATIRTRTLRAANLTPSPASGRAGAWRRPPVDFAQALSRPPDDGLVRESASR